MSLSSNFPINVNGHNSLSGQIQNQSTSGRTTSSKEREKPLAFKRTSKKRSWVWDWFEQDQINKYRAVCLYCHSEIFRTENDKGSPKKLETHLSKHNVTKDNYMDKDIINLRNSKISLYGKINGRGNKSVTFAPIQPTNLGPINNSSEPQTPLISNNQTTFIQHEFESNNNNSVKESTPISQSATPILSSNSQPQQNNHQSFSYQPVQSPPSNFNQQTHNNQLQFHHNQFFPPPPPHFVGQPFHPPPPPHQFNHHQLQFQPPQVIDNQIIDPSLHNLNNESISKNLLNNIDIESINKYNYLVEKHNNFLENYNKSLLIKNNLDLVNIEKNIEQKIAQNVDLNNDEQNVKINKEFLKMATPITENKSQKAIRDFVTNNNLDLNILQDPFFNKMIEIIRENPYDEIN